MSIKNVFILPEAVDDLNENIAYVAAILPMRGDPAWISKQLKERR